MLISKYHQIQNSDFWDLDQLITIVAANFDSVRTCVLICTASMSIREKLGYISLGTWDGMPTMAWHRFITAEGGEGDGWVEDYVPSACRLAPEAFMDPPP